MIALMVILLLQG